MGNEPGEMRGAVSHLLEMAVWLAVLLSALAWGVSGCATAPRAAALEAASPAGAFEETWGVEVQGIRVSAAGYMLDFRYRVLDPEKARPLFERRTKPYLIDEASGARFFVPNPPKTGPLRSTNPPLPGRIYSIIFANPGRMLEPGAQVTVVIGEFRAENLRVQ